MRRPGLRVRLLLLLGVLHVAAAALGAFALRSRPAGLLALEAGLAVTALLSAALVRALVEPMRLVAASGELLREGDFTVRIARSGVAEVDALGAVYNEMADRLRQQRRSLVEQDLFLRRLIEASPAGVVTCDAGGRARLVSPGAERLAGARAATLLGLDPDEAPAPWAALLGGLAPGESRLVTAGERRLRVRRAQFHDRGFPRAFYLIEDLTEELAATEREASERIVQVMAHEVRNTVGVVRSLLESIAAVPGAALPPASAEGVVIASQRLSGLNAFVTAVADVVRLPPLRKSACDLARLVRDVVALAAPEASTRGVVIESAAPASAVLLLDGHQVEQALLNVVRNAVEATPRGRVVGVTLEASDGALVLRVRDAGPGIPQDAEGRLFTPFFTTKPGGHGIGLMLVRDVLGRHGVPHSLATHPGGGAEFTARFGGA